MKNETKIKNKTVKSDDLQDWVNFYNQTIENLWSAFPQSLPPICQLRLLPIHEIEANQYNPNKMASPENALLKRSIEISGLTMPLLVTKKISGSKYVLVDGFHRYSLLLNHPELQSIPGYVPVVILDLPEEECIATSVRHNIARGVHQVELTSNLIIHLKALGLSNDNIGKELGMDRDEVLRMQQITGLASVFQEQDFSKSWN
ncbi:TPA: IbrB-like domain-containing protein [Vibrio vulnificus]